MSHCWHVYADRDGLPRSNQRPIRHCCQCNDHQDGVWYLDHISDIWLIAWDGDQPLCRVVPDFTQDIPGEEARQANWRMN